VYDNEIQNLNANNDDVQPSHPEELRPSGDVCAYVARIIVSAVSDDVVPKSYSQAVKGERWRNAMQMELEAHSRNGTWNWVTTGQIPPGTKLEKIIWLYAVKRSGVLEARTVMLGNRITDRGEYPTFAPSAPIGLLYLAMTLAATLKLRIQGADVSTAFLNADHTGPQIYCHPPDGAVPPAPGMKIKLVKALYGSPWAPRSWWKLISSVLISELKFEVSTYYDSLFFQRRNNSLMVVVLLVDDFAIASSEQNYTWLMAELQKRYKIVEYAKLVDYAGIEIIHKNDGSFSLHQPKYAIKAAQAFGLNPDATGARLPHGVYLSAPEDNQPDPEYVDYPKFMGILQYATQFRLDIAFITSHLAQFNKCHQRQHYEAARKVARYLLRTRQAGRNIIGLKPDQYTPTAWCDSDFAGEETRRSRVGYIIYMGENVIHSKASYPRVKCEAATATCRAEIIAAHDACHQLMVLRKVLREMNPFNLRDGWMKPSPVYIDNQQVIDLVKSDKGPSGHNRLFAAQIHFLRHLRLMGEIESQKVTSRDNVASEMS